MLDHAWSEQGSAVAPSNRSQLQHFTDRLVEALSQRAEPLSAAGTSLGLCLWLPHFSAHRRMHLRDKPLVLSRLGGGEIDIDFTGPALLHRKSPASAAEPWRTVGGGAIPHRNAILDIHCGFPGTRGAAAGGILFYLVEYLQAAVRGREGRR